MTVIRTLFPSLLLAVLLVAGAPVPGSASDKLPDPVARMHAAILDAARTGEIEKMRSVLEMNKNMPKVSFGGASDPISFWKQSSGDKKGREILAALVSILEMPWVRTGEGTSGEMYVWPYLAEADLEKLSPPEEVDLYRLVSPQEAQIMREFGGYIWYRLGIGADGTWHFFVAGD
jgi:hypothetical protein